MSAAGEEVAPVASLGTTLDDLQNARSSTSDPTDFNRLLEAKPLAADSTTTSDPSIPSVSAWAVLGESTTMAEGTPQCRGHNFDEPLTDGQSFIDKLIKSFETTGFQATNVALAVEQIRQLRAWRLSHTPWREGDDPALQPPSVREKIRARIFLAYTSNQISCGQREVLRFLVQHKMVDILITSAGGIEEDIIKCFQPTFMGDFSLSGRELRRKGINRIGNLLVPNKNYCDFENWFSPIINSMHDEQDMALREWAQEVAARKLDTREPMPTHFVWTPSRVIHRLGKEINHPDSVLYWAAVNNIPVFCPALTDGSIGDMLFFHSYKRGGFVLDIAQDIRLLNELSLQSHCSGQIILGGGLVKHHCNNANLMRNGADYSIYINTGHEFDGSDSGASPDEAVSWGKIRLTAKPVKINGEASFVFPLIVAATFAKDVEQWKEATKDCVCWMGDLPGENADD